jgi:hypothetical protein
MNRELPTATAVDDVISSADELREAAPHLSPEKEKAPQSAFGVLADGLADLGAGRGAAIHAAVETALEGRGRGGWV